ncbi:hypothetical protein WJX84_004116 [Apatococcus fuscideae]|uniref:Quinolinate synthase, chloroplastic n=1 Tax=Apatococcus fuscideae TaxID=2026836 RepID=A0AAW1T6J4_9CHLO
MQVSARPLAQRRQCQAQQLPQLRGATRPRKARASAATVESSAATALKQSPLQQYAEELGSLDTKQRLQRVLQIARSSCGMSEQAKISDNRVMGCTAQVWLEASLDPNGRVQLTADSDSELTRGMCTVLTNSLSGLLPDDFLQVEPSAFAPLGLGPNVVTPSRAINFANLLETARKRVLTLVERLPSFPSLLISADALEPQGDFAKAQAQFLKPDAGQVDRLVQVLSDKKIGVVAHFYMDPEVQGVLSQAAERWPHINISDSLAMADRAVKMAEEGCKAIAVLGVDFMSENVRAILDEAGHRNVEVYRMAEAEIGCSLAEAAESDSYTQYLQQAASRPGPALHVVYINTSLRTKAHAHNLVPTITCTSGNVVQTILQAFAQVPDLTLWYGPDTYMGRNLAQMFTSMASLSNEAIAELHPAHTQATIKAMLPRLHCFQEGACIVHHLFGSEVTQLVQKAYGDAFLTAHFEVPGEMFTLAMAARERERGVVGSTSDILGFIAKKVKAAVEMPFPERLQVVLGTESGMITSIVRRVQGMLREAGRSDIQVEIVFPVASEAISTDQTLQSQSMPGGPQGTVEGSLSSLDPQGGNSGSLGTLPGGLSVLPGPAGGEGCSAEGGCASCPFMKMNTLEALFKVCDRFGTPGQALLEAYRPKQYTQLINGRSIAEAGCEPILHMRGFQRSKALPAALEADIKQRAASIARSAATS